MIVLIRILSDFSTSPIVYSLASELAACVAGCFRILRSTFKPSRAQMVVYDSRTTSSDTTRDKY